MSLDFAAFSPTALIVSMASIASMNRFMDLSCDLGEFDVLYSTSLSDLGASPDSYFSAVGDRRAGIVVLGTHTPGL